MDEIIFTTSAAARRLGELGKPRSEGWVRLAAVTGKLPCIVTTTGRRVFRESDLEAVAKKLDQKAEPIEAA